MSKNLSRMSRQELINLYVAELGGSMEDFNGYANKWKLRQAITSIQELKEEEARKAAFASGFEFMEDEVEDVAVEDEEAAHSDQWYIARGLPIPKE